MQDLGGLPCDDKPTKGSTSSLSLVVACLSVSCRNTFVENLYEHESEQELDLAVLAEPPSDSWKDPSLLAPCHPPTRFHFQFVLGQSVFGPLDAFCFDFLDLSLIIGNFLLILVNHVCL